MKYLIVALVLFCVSVVEVIGQEEIRITALSDSVIANSWAARLTDQMEADSAKQFAMRDIENQTPFLLIDGGASPTFTFDQLYFERQYKIYYYRNSCLFPEPKIAMAYNFTILDHSYERYGESFIDRISEDVFGLEEWKDLKGEKRE
jgi:hypothetical protein